ncbi:MAG TPA: transcription termination factor NusA [Planctomycetes bacterium]|nr:transcription termination factor NusA [Planctomycetota bacterium]
MQGGPELVKFVQAMAREKGLDEEILFDSLEAAMGAAARKRFTEAEELEISVNRSTGAFNGVVDGRPVTSQELESLGRIAAQTFKQVLLQRVREAEQDKIYEEFIEKRGQLVTGSVQRFEGDNIICDLNQTEAILPRHERIRTETYHVGDRIRAVIADVKKVGHRVRIVLSRTHTDLIRRLFELEIPEIADHIIEIKALAREAGFRTKLAVVSYDSKVDCVGACVGIRGSRIRNIIDELNGEKIDIIRWNESPEILIMNALKPAEILSITLDDETGEAIVTVAEDQLSLAIGRRGQNVRLAARLTGWDVNIMGAGGELPESMKRHRNQASEGPLNAQEKQLLESLKTGEGPEPVAVADAAEEEATTDASEGEERDPLLEMARFQAAKDEAGAAGLTHTAHADGDEMPEATASTNSNDEGDEDPLAAAAARMMTEEPAADSQPEEDQSLPGERTEPPAAG